MPYALIDTGVIKLLITNYKVQIPDVALAETFDLMTIEFVTLCTVKTQNRFSITGTTFNLCTAVII